MKLTKLVDATWLRFIGLALVKSSGPQYVWRPRYAPDGSIYCWIRDNDPKEDKT